MGKFKPRTATVPIYQGNWQQLIGAAYAAADAARQRLEKTSRTPQRPRLMHEASETADLEAELDRLAKEHDDLVAEAIASGEVLDVTLQALGWREWAALVAQHPPRTDEDLPQSVRDNDAAVGVNDEAMADALLPRAIVEISDPEISVADLLEGISSAQRDFLYGTAFALNRAVGADPKSQPRLLPSPSSAETESSPSGSD